MSVPWFIGGGAQHDAEVARLLAYNATQGNEGVTGPNDMKVLALSVPGGAVRITPGACTVLNRSPGGIYQSYLDRESVQQQVTIAPTGSGGGRTDLIVRRIEDPQYAPWPEVPVGDMPTSHFGFYRVIQGVPANTKSARELNLGYSAIALARVTLPASTGTVQNAHITDLRKVANPQRTRHLYAYDLSSGQADTLGTTAESWPDIGGFDVPVPEWAVTAHIVATYAQVLIPAGSSRGGFLWPRLTSSISGRTVAFKAEGAPSASRATYVAAGDIAVPASVRGTTVYSYTSGQVTGGSGGNPILDANSAVVLDIEFFEKAI